jgi:hypothetical protein
MTRLMMSVLLLALPALAQVKDAGVAEPAKQPPR